MNIFYAIHKYSTEHSYVLLRHTVSYLKQRVLTLADRIMMFFGVLNGFTNKMLSKAENFLGILRIHDHFRMLVGVLKPRIECVFIATKAAFFYSINVALSIYSKAIGLWSSISCIIHLRGNIFKAIYIFWSNAVYVISATIRYVMRNIICFIRKYFLFTKLFKLFKTFINSYSRS